MIAVASFKHILAAVVVLTNAQIVSLPTTPIELVPAPGDGKLIVPVLLTVSWNFPQPYQNVNQLVTQTNFGWGTHQYIGMPATMGVYTTNLTGQFAGSNTFSAPTGIWNLPFMVWVTNYNLGNFTGGDPSNTMTIKFEYVIDEL